MMIERGKERERERKRELKRRRIRRRGERHFEAGSQPPEIGDGHHRRAPCGLLFHFFSCQTVRFFRRLSATAPRLSKLCDRQGVPHVAGGHINPAVTFGLFLARKLFITRTIFYIVMQCLGAICGAGVVKGFQPTPYQMLGGGAIVVAHGCTKGDGLGAEIIGTFVLVYIVFSTDAKRNARDSHVLCRNWENWNLLQDA